MCELVCFWFVCVFAWLSVFWYCFDRLNVFVFVCVLVLPMVLLFACLAVFGITLSLCCSCCVHVLLLCGFVCCVVTCIVCVRIVLLVFGL